MSHTIEFGDGPLDGHRIEVPDVPDQVLIVCQRSVYRYECDREDIYVVEEGTDSVYRMVQPSDTDDFDDDLFAAMEAL